MKKKKYLPLYHKAMKTGWLPKEGLCLCVNPQKDLNNLIHLMKPKVFIDFGTPMFWAYCGDEFNDEYRSSSHQMRSKKFTPLRQNIVLLMAVMNGEL